MVVGYGQCGRVSAAISVGRRTDEIEKRLDKCLATEDRVMARFFFDHHDANGIFRDEVGDELPTAAIARAVALRTVGEVVRDLTFGHSEGRVTIDVRDGEEHVFRVSAVVETTSSKL